MVSHSLKSRKHMRWLSGRWFQWLPESRRARNGAGMEEPAGSESPGPPSAWPQLAVESGTNHLTACSAPLWNKHQYSSPASLARCSRRSRHMINVKWMNIGMCEYPAGRQRVEWDGGLENAWEITEFFAGKGWHYYSQNLIAVLMVPSR